MAKMKDSAAEDVWIVGSGFDDVFGHTGCDGIAGIDDKAVIVAKSGQVHLGVLG
jgi:hypothetical protein